MDEFTASIKKYHKISDELFHRSPHFETRKTEEEDESPELYNNFQT